MSTPNDAFVAWLRAARRSAGLSQQEVAEALAPIGLTLYQQTIAKIETSARDISLSEAVALASLFGATVDVALGLPGATSESATPEARRSTDHTALLAKIRVLIDAEIGGAS